VKKVRKIIFLFAGLLICPAALMAASARNVPAVNQCVYKSSFTKTNDTTKYITDSRYLKAIVVSSATAGAFCTVYNSTWTAANQVLPAVDLGTLGVYEVNLYMDQGITYTTTGNANGVSLIWRAKEQ
jgi:hypothetical protein